MTCKDCYHFEACESTQIYSIFESGVEAKETYFIAKGVIKSFCIEKNLTSFYAVYEEGIRYWHNSPDFDKKVFFSREEAEKALEEITRNERKEADYE